MLYYKIIPKCNTDLVLTLNLDDNDNRAVLRTPSEEAKDRQLWSPIEVISGDDKGFALFNKYSQQVLAARGDRQPLTQISPSDILKNRATWKFLGSDFGAIQLHANTDMNLNAFGDGPYQPGNTVGIHDWKAGEPNEVWRLSLVGDF